MRESTFIFRKVTKQWQRSDNTVVYFIILYTIHHFDAIQPNEFLSLYFISDKLNIKNSLASIKLFPPKNTRLIHFIS
jgi:hypothetical protein